MEKAMKASSLFVASLALALSSFVPANAAPVNSASGKNAAFTNTADERTDGCSYSNQYAFSQGCKNPAHFKTYNQCLEAGIKVGWKGSEMAWYCTSLRLP
jgi:hypothetical protein